MPRRRRVAAMTIGWLVMGACCGSADPPASRPAPAAGPVTDRDGNVYRTVRIGPQVWMAQDLRVTRYRDGSPLPLAIDDAEWRAAVSRNAGHEASGFCVRCVKDRARR
jgi:hypothetical protein